TVADAGAPQILCNLDTTLLVGNDPAVGTGTWSIVSGAVTLDTLTNDSTVVRGMVPGNTYTFRWTISSGTCPVSSDDVSVQIVPLPTTADAGPDIGLCNLTDAVMAATPPAIGTAVWTQDTGPAAILADDQDPA